MLSKLSVKHFALLENLEIEFQPGLNVITGETGAGKSLIINALNSILGEKVSVDLLRTGADKAVVEGLFRSYHPAIDALLRDRDIDIFDGELILRREINRSGRSRSFVNDCVVQQREIKAVSDLMVDLHGQHEHQSLLQPEQHIVYLDAYAGLEASVADLGDLFGRIRKAQRELEALREKGAALKDREEYIRFQIREIDALEIAPGEEERLDKEERILANYERLADLCSRIYAALYEQQDSAYARVDGALTDLGELRNIDKSFEEVHRLLESSYLGIDEAARFIQDYLSGTEYDPARLESIRQRLSDLNRLKKKHGLPVDGLLDKLQTLKQEAAHIENLDEDLEQLVGRIREETESLERLCDQLSRERGKALRSLEGAIAVVLDRIGMKQGKLRVTMGAFSQGDGQTIALPGGRLARATGADQISFSASTNPGSGFKPLVQIASGGELSRIMLAIKSVLAGKDQINVLVFDEIDMGISGRIAESVGRELKELARKHQIICVTHLPQIASFADRHFSVRKEVSDGQTTTSVHVLDAEQRVQEIAGLLAGEKTTDLALRNAAEMLSANSS